MVSTVRVPYTLYSNVYFIQKRNFFFSKLRYKEGFVKCNDSCR